LDREEWGLALGDEGAGKGASAKPSGQLRRGKDFRGPSTSSGAEGAPDFAQDDTSSARLEVGLRHRIGALRVDVSFLVTKPWTILFGPSGSGKTTILRSIAGLVRPAWGRIVGSETYMDSDAGVLVECHKRGIPLAMQTASLFPHRTVREQIAYGMGSGEVEMETMFGLFRIGHLADRYPRALSGGEAQRVNLARAARAATHVLLLDEPFTGLDAGLRTELMGDLQAWALRRKLCVLSVTHDVAEAFQLGAEVIKLAEGRVVAQGPVGVVLAEERARLLGQLGGLGDRLMR